MSDAMSQAAAPVEAAPAENQESAESQENQEQSEQSLEASGQEGQETRTDAEIEADKSLSKEEKKIEKRLNKLKIKYNGKEMEEDLPFEIPDDPKAVEYMQKQLQLAKLSQSKSQEFSKLQKEAIEFIEQLRKNPKAILSDPTIGLDLKKFAAEIIEEEIENAKKTPEQIELEKAKAELKRIKEEREKDEAERKELERQRLTEEAFKNYETQVESALEKSDLPKTPYTVKKMADWMMLGLENNVDISPAEAAELVKEEMHNDLKQMFAVMPEDVIEQIVGKETFNRVRKKNLAKAKAAPKAPNPIKTSLTDTGLKAEKQEKPVEKKNFKQFFGI